MQKAQNSLASAQNNAPAQQAAIDSLQKADQQLTQDIARLEQNQSTNLYDTLRRVFGQMGRRDLAEMVVNGMDTDGEPSSYLS